MSEPSVPCRRPGQRCQRELAKGRRSSTAVTRRGARGVARSRGTRRERCDAPQLRQGAMAEGDGTARHRVCGRGRHPAVRYRLPSSSTPALWGTNMMGTARCYGRCSATTRTSKCRAQPSATTYITDRRGRQAVLLLKSAAKAAAGISRDRPGAGLEQGVPRRTGKTVSAGRGRRRRPWRRGPRSRRCGANGPHVRSGRPMKDAAAVARQPGGRHRQLRPLS